MPGADVDCYFDTPRDRLYVRAEERVVATSRCKGKGSKSAKCSKSSKRGRSLKKKGSPSKFKSSLSSKSSGTGSVPRPLPKGRTYRISLELYDAHNNTTPAEARVFAPCRRRELLNAGMHWTDCLQANLRRRNVFVHEAAPRRMASVEVPESLHRGELTRHLRPKQDPHRKTRRRDG